MRRELILALAGLAAAPAAGAHSLSPGRQTVQTMGERAFVRLEASNGRKDVSAFAVEVFGVGGWTPSRIAVASPARLTIPPQAPGAAESTARVISVLVDLDGKPEQRLRVCTKSLSQQSALLPQTTRVNSRVCVNVTVRRFAP